MGHCATGNCTEPTHIDYYLMDGSRSSMCFLHYMRMLWVNFTHDQKYRESDGV